jgi:hypothetical protein
MFAGDLRRFFRDSLRNHLSGTLTLPRSAAHLSASLLRHDQLVRAPGAVCIMTEEVQRMIAAMSFDRRFAC